MRTYCTRAPIPMCKDVHGTLPSPTPSLIMPLSFPCTSQERLSHGPYGPGYTCAITNNCCAATLDAQPHISPFPGIFCSRGDFCCALSLAHRSRKSGRSFIFLSIWRRKGKELGFKAFVSFLSACLESVCVCH